MHLTKYTEGEIADMYVPRACNLTQSYLLKKNLIWLGTREGGRETAVQRTRKDRHRSSQQLRLTRI